MPPAASIRIDDAPAVENDAGVFTVHRAPTGFTFPDQLARAAKVRGGDPVSLIREYAGLAMGPGKLRFEDYIALRLFDDDFIQGADKTAFGGRQRNSEFISRINFQTDWRGIGERKIVACSYLAAYGFPTGTIQAVYRQGLDSHGASILGSPEGLKTFLGRSDLYPMFAKPVSGAQSLGSTALMSLSPKGDQITLGDGRETLLDAFVEEIVRHYADGYMFQTLVRAAPTVAPVLGPWVATARVVTALIEGRTRVLRACLKIPTGGNHADNYWRAGNLLAQVDLDTGAIKAVTQGGGLDMQPVTHHPDTGADLIGYVLPNWRGVLDLALSAQALLEDIPIIGWDMAATSEQPLIIEPNSTPDLYLNQFSDRRGMLTEEMLEFEKRQMQGYKAHERKRKRDHMSFVNYGR